MGNETNGFTLWFTGLSGAGKSTIAEIVGPDDLVLLMGAGDIKELGDDLANKI